MGALIHWRVLSCVPAPVTCGVLPQIYHAVGLDTDLAAMPAGRPRAWPREGCYHGDSCAGTACCACTPPLHCGTPCAYPHRQNAVAHQVHALRNIPTPRNPKSHTKLQVWVRGPVHNELHTTCHCTPAGDLTPVGEGGTGLSGGQRLRVALARALYQPSTSLYLFDDILASLDSHVAQVGILYHPGWVVESGSFHQHCATTMTLLCMTLLCWCHVAQVGLGQHPNWSWLSTLGDVDGHCVDHDTYVLVP
jgi:hypothetical protein